MAYRQDFDGYCCSPGCFSPVIGNSLVCKPCRRVEFLYKSTARLGEAPTLLEKWLLLPEQRRMLQGDVHINVGYPVKHFLPDELLAAAEGKVWMDRPRSLYEEFEEHCFNNGCFPGEKHGEAPGRKWFAERRTFSYALHASGFVINDIHADAFPEINKAIFVPDFAAVKCAFCQRPALVTHLEGRHQYASMPESMSTVTGGIVLFKGRAMDQWHPMLRLTRHKKRPRSQPLHLCVRHANDAVNTAIITRLWMKRQKKRGEGQLRGLPKELMEKILHHVMHG